MISDVADETSSPDRRRLRPRSVISDICGEEPRGADNEEREQAEGETSYQSIAVSDVLSPDGKRSQTRLKVLFSTFVIKFLSFSQECVSNFKMNRQHTLIERSFFTILWAF